MKNKYWLMLVLFIMPALAQAQLTPVDQEAKARQIIQQGEGSSLGSDGVLIKKIIISGIGLRDKQKLERIIKSHQKKKLNDVQLQQMIDDIKVLYLEAGYSGLVDIKYALKKNVLTITVLLLGR